MADIENQERNKLLQPIGVTKPLEAVYQLDMGMVRGTTYIGERLGRREWDRLLDVAPRFLDKLVNGSRS